MTSNDDHSKIKKGTKVRSALFVLAIALIGCEASEGGWAMDAAPDPAADPAPDVQEAAGDPDAARDPDASGDPDAEVRADPDAGAEADAEDEETIVPPPCGDGVCEKGVEHCGNCEADCCACPPEAVLIDCPLTDGSACSGDRSGGAFTAEGWSSTGWESRIVFDLGAPVHCGAAHVHLGPFNPMTQYVHHGGEDRYCDFFDIFQQNTGNHWEGARGRECWVDLQASDEEPDSFRDHKIKIKPHTGTGDGFGGGQESKYTAHEINWEVPHDLCLQWNGERVDLFIDGRQETGSTLTWGTDGATGPGLQYLFVGRGRDAAGGYINGATYSNVRVVAGGTCL